MFICSVRISTIKFVSVVLLSVVAFVTLLAFVPTYESTALITAKNKISFEGGDTKAGRVAFAAQYGWTLSKESETEKAITIPSQFNETYESYNAIQKAQGLNLEKYKGKEATQYTYIVTNYPEYDGKVILTMIVYKRRIIGGDVAAAAINGFTQGFARQS